MIPESQKDPRQEESKEKNTSSLNDSKTQDKFDELYSLTQSNKLDTVVLIILLIGILVSVYNLLYGGLLIGIVFGYYFADDLMTHAKNIRNYIENEGNIKALVIGGLVIGLFIATPAIFIGALAAIAVKLLVKALRKQ